MKNTPLGSLIVSISLLAILPGLAGSHLFAAEQAPSLQELMKQAKAGLAAKKKAVLDKLKSADALYEQGKFPEAKKLYTEVATSQVDIGYEENRKVLKRLTGIDELIQKTQAEAAEKEEEQKRKATLAKYQQARKLHHDGDLAKAKALFLEVQKEDQEGDVLSFFDRRDLKRYLERADERMKVASEKRQGAAENLAQLELQLRPLLDKTGMAMLTVDAQTRIDACEKLVDDLQEESEWLGSDRAQQVQAQAEQLAQAKTRFEQAVIAAKDRFKQATAMRRGGDLEAALKQLAGLPDLSAPSVTAVSARAKAMRSDIESEIADRQRSGRDRLTIASSLLQKLEGAKQRREAGDHEGAVRLLDEVIRSGKRTIARKPVLDDNVIDQARAMARDSDSRLAEARRATRERSKQVQALLAQGKKSAAEGRYAEAQTAIDRIQKLRQEDPKIAVPAAFGPLAQEVSAAVAAEKADAEAVAAKRQDLDAGIGKGEVALTAGDYDEALDQFATVVAQARESKVELSPTQEQRLEDLVKKASDARRAAQDAQLKAALAKVKDRQAAALVKATQEDRAQARARQLLDMNRIAQQQRQVEANHHYEVGKGFFERAHYAMAIEELQKAAKLVPDHEEAVKLLARSQALLQKGALSIGDFTKEVALEEEVRIIEAKLDLSNAIRDANELMSEREYEKAIEKYEEALANITFLEKQVDVSGERRMVESLLSQARKKDKAAVEQIMAAQEREAMEEVTTAERDQQKSFRRKKSVLFTQGWKALREERFEDAYEIADQILDLDPEDQSAKILRDRAFEEKHVRKLRKIKERFALELKKHTEQTYDRALPLADFVNYPDKEVWEDVISKRSEVSSEPGTDRETPETLKIREKLKDKISLDFADTPVTDVVAFLHDVSGINMMLDPDALEDEDGPLITLKVEDMPLENALDVILRRFAKLDYIVREDGLFISSEEGLSEYDLRTYDVRDLLINFGDPSGEVSFSGGGGGGGGGGFGGGGGGEEDEMDISQRAVDLLTLISTIIKPESWMYAFVSGGGEDADTEIELVGEGEDAQGGLVYREGDLIVWQTPAIHTEISKLLTSLRESKNMQVNIEARFVTVTDRFAELFGVQFDRFIPDPRTAANQTTDPDGHRYNEPNPSLFVSSPNVTRVYPSIAGNNFLNTAGMQGPTALPFIGTGLSTTDLTSAGLNLSFSFLGEHFIDGMLRAAQTSDQAEVLSCPRITLSNTQRGYIVVATNRPYVSGYTATSQQMVPTISNFDIGVMFDVRPIVSSDRRYVFLELSPQTTDMVQIHTFTFMNVTGTGTAQQSTVNTIQQPEIMNRMVMCTICVPDRGTVLIGGLSNRRASRTSQGVPVLSKIPIIKRLFQSDNISKTRDNLLIIVKPTIIIQDEEEDKI